MNKNLLDAKKENNEEAEEYLKYIKGSVEDGSYFKDALNWYSFRYITPICDRTLLIFGAIIAAVVLFFLVQMVRSAFPLVEEVPIFISAKDKSKYFPNLVNLKPRKGEEGYDMNVKNTDEAVLKHLLINYVTERESFDFRNAEVESVNQMFNNMKNTSEAEVYRSFQIFMSKDNPLSPINYFGKNVTKDVKIESVNFVRRKQKGFRNQAQDFLIAEIPVKAKIRFVATTTIRISEENIKKEGVRYAAEIDFDFGGVLKDRSGYLGFKVTNYRLFRVN